MMHPEPGLRAQERPTIRATVPIAFCVERACLTAGADFLRLRLKILRYTPTDATPDGATYEEETC
jgi:hypothetical protein